ncbi:MAG: hypothetical protein WDN30_09305 [Pararobbsia sp.]
MLIAHRYALRPGIGSALAVILAGIVLFFSHGLIFVFSCAVGVGFLFFEQLVKQRASRSFLFATAPYCVFGVLCVVYTLITQDGDPMVTVHDYLPGLGWDMRHRYLFLLYILGTRTQDAMFLWIDALMFAAPFLLGLRLNRADPSAMVPLIVVIGVWIFMPGHALKISLMYERFTLFLMPAYAMAFCAELRGICPSPRGSGSTSYRPSRRATTGRPQIFDWKKNHGRLYRYFIVRDSHEQGKRALANPECEIRLVRRIADWSLYERGACR